MGVSMFACVRIVHVSQLSVNAVFPGHTCILVLVAKNG